MFGTEKLHFQIFCMGFALVLVLAGFAWDVAAVLRGFIQRVSTGLTCYPEARRGSKLQENVPHPYLNLGRCVLNPRTLIHLARPL